MEDEKSKSKDENETGTEPEPDPSFDSQDPNRNIHLCYLNQDCE